MFTDRIKKSYLISIPKQFKDETIVCLRENRSLTEAINDNLCIVYDIMHA